MDCGFPFLQAPARSRKPRTTGVTVVSDKAKSLQQARDYVETVGDVIDHIKLPDHVGLLWRYSVDYIRKKNAIYAAAGIKSLPGGIPFEVAAVQGKIPEFMDRVAELGFGGVEVSEDSIGMRPDDRIRAIRHGIRAGLTVFTELGKKDPSAPLDVNEATDMAKRDLDAGAHMVVLEKSDVAIVIRNKSDTLHRLMNAVGPKHFIVECGPGDDRFQIARWLIEQFGPEVNLENIDVEDAYIVETMRYGMGRQMNYAYFKAWEGKDLPRVAD